MAVRPVDFTSKAFTRTFKVAAGQTVTKGLGVIFAAADDEIQVSGANGKAFGTALESGVAGDKVKVAMHGHAVIPVTVGTGGATRGEYAVMAADGYTNQTLGGGNTVRYIAGIFMQTEIAGNRVGLLIGAFAAGSA